jgi:GNAT superfamily N-acetyltransferase
MSKWPVRRSNETGLNDLGMNYDKQNIQEHRRDRFLISTDAARLDVDFIHDQLAHKSYWAAGIPRDVVVRCLNNSLCFGVYEGSRQIGLARVVTDHSTYAYLCDVFIAEGHRGHGLGTWLIECVLAHPDLQGLRRFTLATRDAHGLYRKFGFAVPDQPENLMEKRWPNVYQKTAQSPAPDL